MFYKILPCFQNHGSPLTPQSHRISVPAEISQVVTKPTRSQLSIRIGGTGTAFAVLPGAWFMYHPYWLMCHVASKHHWVPSTSLASRMKQPSPLFPCSSSTPGHSLLGKGDQHLWRLHSHMKDWALMAALVNNPFPFSPTGLISSWFGLHYNNPVITSCWNQLFRSAVGE